MAQLKAKIYPFGSVCEAMEGEVSEEIKQWLIETERCTKDDFEPKENKNKKQK